MTLAVVVVGVLGLAIGSFLNVVIYRVPRGESIVRPGSHCPSCQGQVRTRNNIPVFSWLMLRGKCADCAAPIGARYPLVEAGTAVLFVAVTARVAQLHLLAALPAYLYFVAAGIALSVIDFDCRRLPNAIVYPSYPAVALLLTIGSAASHDWHALERAGIGGVALFAFYFALAFAYPAGMGFGDVKLSGILGALLAYLSWSALAFGAFAGFLFGALIGIGVVVTRHGDRKTALPFGPFMIAGVLTAIFAVAPLMHLYTHVTSGV
jgi:leader peptidase (prepilin peptidase)/N-methyltransferase